MVDLFLWESDIQWELFQVVCEEFLDLVNVFPFHCSHPWNAGFVGELQDFHVAGLSCGGGETWKSDIQKLLRIQTTMPVGRFWYGDGDNYPCSVDSLPNIVQIDSPGDFLDQDRR